MAMSQTLGSCKNETDNVYKDISKSTWSLANLSSLLSVTMDYYEPKTILGYYELFNIRSFLKMLNIKYNRNNQNNVTRKQLIRANWFIFKHFYGWGWILFGVLMSFWHSIASNIAYYYHTPNYISWDIGFCLFPEKESFRTLTETLFWTIVIIGISSMLLLYYLKHPKIMSIMPFIRYAKVSGFVTLLRTISFLSTSIPGPSVECLPGSDHYNPPHNLHEILFTFSSINGCGDLLFSGHMSLSLTISIIVSHYAYYVFPKHWKYIAVFMFGLELILASLIIIIRNHYTVDIVIAAYTAPLVYYCIWYIFPDPKLNLSKFKY